MSFPCQSIDACPNQFSGYTAPVNDGCRFAISAGPNQNISLGIICTSQGGPPTLCSGGTWPPSPGGLPYLNSGNLSAITILQGTVTASGADLIFTPNGTNTYALFNGAAVGDFIATYTLTENDPDDWENGIFLIDGTQQIVYRFWISNPQGDTPNVHADLSCGGIDGSFTQFAVESFTPVSSPFSLKFQRSNTLIAVYLNNVLILCAETGLTENANIGIFASNSLPESMHITAIDVEQS